MELILKRIAKRSGYTIGKLYIKQQTLSDSPLKGEDSGQEASPSMGTENLPSPMGEGSGERLWSYLCDTLEPTWRDYKHGAYKIKGKSAIPEGQYAVVISYSPKFRQWLPILLGGPEFNKQWQGIRIHAGNSAKDTEGCILVGENREVGRLLNSRKWLYELKHRIVEAKDRGEAIKMTVQ